MQPSLDNWLNTDQRIYNVYYLKWNNDNPTTEWLLNKPKKYNISKTVKWKNVGCEVLLLGDIESNTQKSLEDFKHTSLLKSNLQKCVRRGLLNESLSTAKLMIKTDFIQFIRRLSIIMFEDTTLHNSLGPLVWMIGAYPKWQPCKKHINWLLGLVKYLVLNKYQEQYSKKEFDFRMNLKTINSLNPPERNLIYSMTFRASYGGMPGDIGMINCLIEMWIERFKSNKYYNVFDTFQPIQDKIKNIKTNQILLESVDFHCYPQMINKIKGIHLNLSQEEIKKAIWFHRSCYNYRDYLDDKELPIINTYSDIWEIIKTDVNKISRQYIYSIS